MSFRISLTLAFTILWALPSLAASDGETKFNFKALNEYLKLYGYFSTRYEKVWNEPALVDGQIVEESAPGEFGFPYFSIMTQQEISKNIKVFINLNGEDFDTINVANAWGEYKFSDKFHVRVGKIYRTFGLYNELLDAVPAYFGIEPPELFDNDHLLISRTTNVMAWGQHNTEGGTLRYSFTTDDGEGDRSKDTFPVGFDLRYSFNFDSQTVGISGYTSGGETGSDVGLGDGSPNSGVLPWMVEDEFDIIGGFWEGTFSNLTLQFEYWSASHSGIRNADDIVTIINEAGLLPTQVDRFLIDPNGPVSAENVDTNADYDVETWYIRAGYSIFTKKGEVVPYVQWDWYSNPETIANKTYGGDAEAGAADDGEFSKATLGIAYRPTPKTAVKLDFSSHYYTLNGEDVDYPEVRLDFSYIFGKQ